MVIGSVRVQPNGPALLSRALVTVLPPSVDGVSAALRDDSRGGSGAGGSFCGRTAEIAGGARTTRLVFSHPVRHRACGGTAVGRLQRAREGRDCKTCGVHPGSWARRSLRFGGRSGFTSAGFGNCPRVEQGRSNFGATTTGRDSAAEQLHQCNKELNSFWDSRTKGQNEVIEGSEQIANSPVSSKICRAWPGLARNAETSRR